MEGNGFNPIEVNSPPIPLIESESESETQIKENTWMDLIGFIIFAIIFILILIFVLYLSITSPKVYTGVPSRGITFSF
jgi:hypothetical protein